MQAIEYIIRASKAESVRDVVNETNAARRAIDELEQEKLLEIERDARSFLQKEQANTSGVAAADVPDRIRRAIRDQPQA